MKATSITRTFFLIGLICSGIFLSSCKGGTTTDTEEATKAAEEAAKYSIGSDSGGAFTDGALEIETTNISTNGSTQLTAYIKDENGLLSRKSHTVSFTSNCVVQGLATFDVAKVTTTNGIASTTYTDMGCTSSDTVSASFSISGVVKVAQGAISTTSSSTLSIGGGSGSSFSDGQLEIKINTINPYGSTEVSAYIVDSDKLLSTGDYIVTFSSNCSVQSKASFSNSSVSTKTGIASTTYFDQGCDIADTITATAMLNGEKKVANGNVTINSSVVIPTLKLGNGTGSTFTEGSLEIKVNTIEVGGSTLVSAYIVDENGLLTTNNYDVSFSSNCSVLGKALISNEEYNSGIATITYSDNGCISSDTITAKVTLNGVLNVASGEISINESDTSDPYRIGSGTGSSFSEGTLEIKSGSIVQGSSTEVSAYIVDKNGLLSTDNHSVTFSSNCATLSDATLSGQNYIDGIATITYRSSSCVSSDIITATVEFDGVTKVATGSITITEPDPTTPVVTANKLNLFSNASSLSTGNANFIELTAIAKDSDNKLLEGVEISFSSDGAAIEVTQGSTDNAGVATAKLSTSGDPYNRRVTVTAKSGSVSDIIYVDIVGTSITISGPTSSTFGDTENYQVFLSDGSGSGIAFENISVLTNNTVLNSSSEYITDANGNLTLELQLNQSETLSVQAFSGESFVKADQAIDVSTDELSICIRNTTTGPTGPCIDEMDIGTTYDVYFTWFSAGLAVSSEQVDFFATRGTFSGVSTDVQVTSGEASTKISSTYSGPTLLTAKTSSGPTTSASFEFVATTPNSLVLQAENSSIGPNGESTTLYVVVRDSANNLVKNQAVRFTIVDDVTGGTIANATAITDSLGKASTTYQSSGSTSAKDGVIVRAYIDGQIINEGTDNGRTDCNAKVLCDEVELTVAQQELFVKLGTANRLAEEGSTLYKQPFNVLVTDAAGNPVAGTEITLTLVPTRYRNGCYNQGVSLWVSDFSNTYTSEDVNLNGILDVGEDVQTTNDVLDPGNIASVPRIVTTGEGGYVEFDLVYAKSYAGYVDYTLTASSKVAGTESTDSVSATLLVLAGDVNDLEVLPPNYVSKWEEITRTLADGTIETTVVNSQGTPACDRYFN